MNLNQGRSEANGPARSMQLLGLLAQKLQEHASQTYIVLKKVRFQISKSMQVNILYSQNR